MISNLKRPTTGWPFIISWTIANAIGLGLALTSLITAEGGGIFEFILTGLLLGVAQFTPLYHKLKIEKWVWLSAIGWVVGLWISSFLILSSEDILSEFLVWLILGISMGVSQAFSLSQRLYLYPWWPAVTAISLILAVVCGYLIGGGLAIFLGDTASYLVPFIIGAIFGIGTGLFLEL